MVFAIDSFFFRRLSVWWAMVSPSVSFFFCPPSFFSGAIGCAKEKKSRDRGLWSMWSYCVCLFFFSLSRCRPRGGVFCTCANTHPNRRRHCPTVSPTDRRTTRPKRRRRKEEGKMTKSKKNAHTMVVVDKRQVQENGAFMQVREADIRAYKRAPKGQSSLLSGVFSFLFFSPLILGAAQRPF